MPNFKKKKNLFVSLYIHYNQLSVVLTDNRGISKLPSGFAEGFL